MTGEKLLVMTTTLKDDTMREQQGAAQRKVRLWPLQGMEE